MAKSPEAPPVVQHPYIPMTDADQAAMLEVVGAESIDDLFEQAGVAPDMQKPVEDFNIPEALSEDELLQLYEGIASKNVPVRGGDRLSLLGGMAASHAIPTAVWDLIASGNLLSAYTPYQPEVAQGILEAGFNFQHYMCTLTGMEAGNAGVYNGQMAAAEAAFMALRMRPDRNKVVIWGDVRADIIETIQANCGHAAEIVVHSNDEEPEVDEQTAGVLTQYPNALGEVVDIESRIGQAKEAGAVAIVYSNPLSLAMFKRPSKYGADIIVGDAQEFGIPMSFGGPSVGFMTTKAEHIRQLPARIIGIDWDDNGNPVFALILSARREQHTNREEAHSPICTSQQLLANAAGLYLTLAGKDLGQIAQLNYQNAHYAASVLRYVPGLTVHDGKVFFNEFVVSTPEHPQRLNGLLAEYDIIGGKDVSNLTPGGMLLKFTEIHSKVQIDTVAGAMNDIAQRAGWSHV